ncbi:protein tyrosine phosphatase type IVA 2-like isoform X3 [Meriones unguiculatus]|uniref:protein tyrosine phosphatase type IVA 2-like isoform X3 n=1 Tax=Meriones unguiculatus TaxID=10047 RepID=UPI000B4E8938|nr:protein tyrosine phosphatase type IVA 2-like isoform X3 [Meriones unguiculatus]
MNHAAPVEICYENMRFLITSNPNSATMQKFTEDLPYDDGAPPPNEVVYNWLELLKSRFQEEPGSCVAVHCVSGLGRAPVLVALALIESGMKNEDAVHFIRQKRRGAFNTKQLLFLENYEPKTSARTKSRFRESKVHCCVQ